MNKTILFQPLCAALVLAAAGCSTPRQRQQQKTAENYDRLIEMNARSLELIERLMGEPAAARPAAPASAAPVVSAESVPARPVAVKGRLRSIGSDTMDNLMEYWKAGFGQTHPQIAFYHQGRGSSTAIPALMENKSEVGPMSRVLKASEIESFRTRFGYDPLQLRVAVDAVAVYVHPDNPLAQQGLTFQQLDAIFSKARLRGGDEVLTWGDLGLTGSWADAPIHVYGRNSASGTHSFFRKTVLTKDGEYADRCKALVGSEELVTAIARDRYGIGYSGIGYRTDQVAVVPLSEQNPNEVFPPEMQYAYSGEYPLSRFLYLAVNRNPNAKLSDVVRDFVNYVYSADGQDVVMKDGFFTVSSKIVQEEKAKLGM